MVSKPDAPCYRTWVEQEAARIGSDKCTLALDWNVWCCFEHDLSCHFAKDPRDAYRWFREGAEAPWLVAKEHRRADADKRFWSCNRKLVKAQGGNWFTRRLKLLRTDARYLGVRVGAVLPPF